MEVVFHYITTAVARTGAQLLVVFGIAFALAVVLWFVSRGIRGAVSSRNGMIYYYIVAPGVACYETGHALGCLLTGTKLPTLAAATEMVDNGEDFSLKAMDKSEANAGMWTGFMKCKRSGVYTFTLTQPTKATRGPAAGGYSVRINGKPVVGAGWRETSVDVDLKVGWNKMDIVCQFGRAPALTIAFKPKDSTADPRPLTPAMMFFDKKPEDD